MSEDLYLVAFLQIILPKEEISFTLPQGAEPWKLRLLPLVSTERKYTVLPPRAQEGMEMAESPLGLSN